MPSLTQQTLLYHPIPSSNRIFQNWTGNMQNFDIFAKNAGIELKTMHAWGIYEKVGQVTEKNTLKYDIEGLAYWKMINMQFCQNPVECQLVENSQWMPNIFVLKLAI